MHVFFDDGKRGFIVRGMAAELQKEALAEASRADSGGFQRLKLMKRREGFAVGDMKPGAKIAYGALW
jgi:hypothetical protein